MTKFYINEFTKDMVKVAVLGCVGGKMVFRREGAYAIVAVLVFLVFSVLLFAVPAWSQDGESDDLAGEQVEEELGQDEDNDDNIESLVIDEDCDVSSNARIVFRDQDNNRFTVVNGDNVRIREINDQVVVEDLTDKNEDVEPPLFPEPAPSSDQDIEFIIGSEDEDENEDNRTFRELNINRELVVVRSSGIECAAAVSPPPATPPPATPPPATPPPATPPPATNSDDTNGDGVISQQEQEAAEAEDELNALNETTDGEGTTGEGTTGDDDFDDDFDDDSAVSASVDEGGAEASTPGAVARSGGDPDEQAPLDQQQVKEQGGDVVDEIPTEGPLPETGGVSFLALVLPALGFLLLSGAIVHRFRERR